VFVKAGSRFETIDTSGSSHFLQHLIQRGPASLSREDFNARLQALGSHIQITPGREIIGFSMTVLPEDAPAALSLLLDSVSAPNLDSNQIEAEKELVYRKVLDVCRDQFEHVSESVFYTSFRDHMMGQSKYGIRDNIPHLTKQVIEDFHKTNFVGENVVVVATGNVHHEKIAEIAGQHTKSLNVKSTATPVNNDKPLLTGSVMFQRDDEMANLNVGVAYLAPSYGHPEYFGFKFFEKIMGTFNANEDGFAHLNTAHKQYNYLHRHLGEMTGINLQQTKYEGFSDVGVMTGLIHGNDVWGKQMMYINQHMLSWYSHNLNQVEVFRARARIFNELLSTQASKDLNQEIAKELFYVGRRIPRTEYALRMSNLACEKFLQKVALKWFYDKDIGVAIWGPGHNIISGAYYDRRFMTSTKADLFNIAI
jgi:processing peptidase subunit beta